MKINLFSERNTLRMNSLLKKQQTFKERHGKLQLKLQAFQKQIDNFLSLMNQLQGGDRHRFNPGGDRLDVDLSRARQRAEAPAVQYTPQRPPPQGGNVRTGQAQTSETPLGDGPAPGPQRLPPQGANLQTGQAQTPAVPSDDGAVIAPPPPTGSSTILDGVAAATGPQGSIIGTPEAPALPSTGDSSGQAAVVQAPQGKPGGTDNISPISREELRNVALGEVNDRLQEINDITRNVAIRIEEGAYMKEGAITQDELDTANARFQELRGEINDIVANTSFEGESLLQGGAAENADLTGLVQELENIDFSTIESAKTTYEGELRRGEASIENSSVYHAQETFSAEVQRLATSASAKSQRQNTVSEGLDRASSILEEASGLVQKATQDFVYDDQGNTIEVTDEMRAGFNERFQELRGQLNDVITNTNLDGEAVLRGGNILNANLTGISQFLHEGTDISTQAGAEQAFYDTHSARSIVSEQQENVASNNVNLEELGDFDGIGFFYWED